MLFLLLLMVLPLTSAAPSITLTGHLPSGATSIRVNGVGAGAFDPGRFSSWHHDSRFPLITPNPGGTCPGNIYNANAVWNGASTWNLFFGGWDGVNSCHDSISVAVTTDSFEGVSAHMSAIATGKMIHVNNPSALKVADGEWLMVYTQDIEQDGGQINKPGISGSADGLVWSPRAGGGDFLAMAGYPYNWTAADVNGGNVLLRDLNGTLHLYFVDMKELSEHSVFHATATTPGLQAGKSRPAGLPLDFQFMGLALAEPGRIVNDLKLVNGHYLMGMHANGPEVYSSTSEDPASFPPSSLLFRHRCADDQYIVSLGFVVDGDGVEQQPTRVMGAVYGAGAVPALDNNRVFAAWLQRHVLFVGTDNPPTVWGLGDAERSIGPEALLIDVNKGNLTGHFMVYDTDFINSTARGTLLLEGPVVTVVAGDIWEFKM